VMAKKIVLESCMGCKFIDQFDEAEYRCDKTKKLVYADGRIPSFCPLPDDVGIMLDSRRVYYCGKCDRYTDVNYSLDKHGNRPKSKCYLCGEEVLEPVEVKRLGVC
jgi:hypothetical protein